MPYRFGQASLSAHSAFASPSDNLEFFRLDEVRSAQILIGSPFFVFFHFTPTNMDGSPSAKVLLFCRSEVYENSSDFSFEALSMVFSPIRSDDAI
jgi:hypothetical protein